MVEVDVGDSTKRTKHFLKNLKKFEKDAQVSHKSSPILIQLFVL